MASLWPLREIPWKYGLPQYTHDHRDFGTHWVRASAVATLAPFTPPIKRSCEPKALRLLAPVLKMFHFSTRSRGVLPEHNLPYTGPWLCRSMARRREAGPETKEHMPSSGHAVLPRCPCTTAWPWRQRHRHPGPTPSRGRARQPRRASATSLARCDGST